MEGGLKGGDGVFLLGVFQNIAGFCWFFQSYQPQLIRRRRVCAVFVLQTRRAFKMATERKAERTRMASGQWGAYLNGLCLPIIVKLLLGNT